MLPFLIPFSFQPSLYHTHLFWMISHMETHYASSVAFLSLRSSHMTWMLLKHLGQECPPDATKKTPHKQRMICLQLRSQILMHRLKVEHVEVYAMQMRCKRILYNSKCDVLTILYYCSCIFRFVSSDLGSKHSLEHLHSLKLTN